jgi:uncharacterized membrane protein YsdA (DUF1294 family)
MCGVWKTRIRGRVNEARMFLLPLQDKVEASREESRCPEVELSIYIRIGARFGMFWKEGRRGWTDVK